MLQTLFRESRGDPDAGMRPERHHERRLGRGEEDGEEADCDVEDSDLQLFGWHSLSASRRGRDEDDALIGRFLGPEEQAILAFSICVLDDLRGELLIYC